jgi:hypothetical protein
MDMHGHFLQVENIKFASLMAMDEIKLAIFHIVAIFNDNIRIACVYRAGNALIANLFPI